ncbi:branched-chain amino acid ABC transporter permease, partial [Pseudonocardia oceani]
MTAVESSVEPVEAVRRRGYGRWVSVVVLVVLAAAPLFLAPFATTTLSRVLVFALFAVSLDLLVGVTGLPSLGHAAYFGSGAYAAGWVSINVTAEAPVPLLAGLAVGALAAALTGWITARSAGVFFLMLTLAIGEIVGQVANTWESVTGGANGLTGIPAVRVGGASLVNAGYSHWYVLVVFALGFALVWTVARSPFGDALRGIRDNEPRMRALGYSTSLYKYAVFVLAGGVAGMAGSLLVAQQRLVSTADAGFL